MTSMWKRTTALTSVLGLLGSGLPAAAQPQAETFGERDHQRLVTTQPDPGPDVAPYFIGTGDPRWRGKASEENVAALLRQKIKYVFVLFNENHSFDNEYGTFPGVNGIYSDGVRPRSPAHTPGFTQTYQDINGQTVTVTPFRLGDRKNATFRDSVDHSHTGLANKLHVVNNTPQMDHFSADEYARFAKAGNVASQKQATQFARLVMSHVDCQTIPFFWQYASRFTIFDNIFATEDTPSTPNAVAMLAGQSGETQWVKHPSTTNDPTATGITAPISGTINGTTYTGTATTQGPPLVNDPQPWWGSEFDNTATNRQPTGPKEFYGSTNIASNLTFASVPLSLMGGRAHDDTSQDKNPAFDLPDVQNDINYLTRQHNKPYAWRWYQNGYDHEPTDTSLASTHTNFVAHHEGPQYFGYLANNPSQRDSFRGEGDFFNDMAAGNLPDSGGVFYIRGGYYNLKYPTNTPPIQNHNYPNPNGLTAAEINTINVTKSGDDDHPGYSDSQLSEAMNARVINAIASNPRIWSQSAIIITYDESDGFYDHVAPRILSWGPDSLPLSRGIRVPMLLISPYARVHAVSHAEGDHNSVIETLNAIFGRTPLSQLPDEAKALKDGNSPAFNKFAPAGVSQAYLGPRDTNSPITDSLLSGFEPSRLRGETSPLPAAYAMIPENVVDSFPHYGGRGCKAIGITPEDIRQGISAPAPDGFNSLPSTLPAYN